VAEINELKQTIRDIINEMQNKNASNIPTGGNLGIFEDVNDAIAAAKQAQLKYEQLELAEREAVIAALREQLQPYAQEYAEKMVAETGLGRVADKKIKLEVAISQTPGVEDLYTEVETGDDGMTLHELTPYGVIGAVLPSTNPIETLVNNGIGMLAAGNAVFFSVHPGAKNISLTAIRKINEIIESVIGIKNLFVTVAEPSNDKVNTLMQHDDIAMLVVTGGPGIVKLALTSGKKAVGAGAGNPPALVDETANIKLAAEKIYQGAGFDNGVLCTAEKAVIAVNEIADELIEGFVNEGAYFMTDKNEIDTLLDLTFVDGRPNKKYIGKDAKVILKDAGINVQGDPKLIMMDVPVDHKFVMQEMLMPILPVARARDYEQAKQYALDVEQGLHHTATMHSNNIKRMNEFARAIKTSIFVVNESSFAGLGIGGEGPTTFTISTPTGEGTTTARNFARRRRLVVADGFSLK
jgi:propionaldehyde dehydrogenase